MTVEQLQAENAKLQKEVINHKLSVALDEAIRKEAIPMDGAEPQRKSAFMGILKSYDWRLNESGDLVCIKNGQPVEDRYFRPLTVASIVREENPFGFTEKQAPVGAIPKGKVEKITGWKKGGSGGGTTKFEVYTSPILEMEKSEITLEKLPGLVEYQEDLEALDHVFRQERGSRKFSELRSRALAIIAERIKKGEDVMKFYQQRMTHVKARV